MSGHRPPECYPLGPPLHDRRSGGRGLPGSTCWPVEGQATNGPDPPTRRGAMPLAHPPLNHRCNPKTYRRPTETLLTNCRNGAKQRTQTCRWRESESAREQKLPGELRHIYIIYVSRHWTWPSSEMAPNPMPAAWRRSKRGEPQMRHSPSAGVGRAGETPGWWAAGPWGRWRWDSFTLPPGLVRRPGADKPGRGW